MLEQLKQDVLAANLELPARSLVTYTWGNASGIDREKGLVVIKPSGVPYEELKADDMVVVDLEGNQVEGDMRPSSDVMTHLVLYRSFRDIGGVVHTHSNWATIWAQAERSIPSLGTTHADYFYGEIPCTRNMTEDEIKKDYEVHTGTVIAETFRDRDPVHTPGVLVSGHGPFTWGKDAAEAVHNAVVLETVAMMAFNSLALTPGLNPISRALQDRHFFRKHGADAYYGQK
jgi:L-ribulose-5-phosphate 4-epimerase